MQFPEDAERFRDALTAIVQTLKSKNPNLHLLYVSSRTYGGYALRNGSQEPWAYEGGFAYKWMIEQWEEGQTPGDPWVAWGPYLWANGATPRSDGLAWELEDYIPSDQMHPNASSTAKVSAMLSQFFKTDPTARSWYTTSGE
ncbi:SGNH/GDSL hydrolase family protein [Paenibacillus ginsengarvi]|uniref:SGNH/GDSL hydrolase family protein n=2 Tax=Paenibacillus ginsengarvi TaxID=400777 RepID=A0A3B0BSP3_9BACL|nr:SGNH/GDSL hydrolase family protein [Paenibacillus ginsengarvi]